MAETRNRRIKCLTLKKICIDVSSEELDGPDPKLYPKGEVVLLNPMQYEHYVRKNCVTRDLPLGEE